MGFVQILEFVFFSPSSSFVIIIFFYKNTFWKILKKEKNEQKEQ